MLRPERKAQKISDNVEAHQIQEQHICSKTLNDLTVYQSSSQ